MDIWILGEKELSQCSPWLLWHFGRFETSCYCFCFGTSQISWSITWRHFWKLVVVNLAFLDKNRRFLEANPWSTMNSICTEISTFDSLFSIWKYGQKAKFDFKIENGQSLIYSADKIILLCEAINCELCKHTVFREIKLQSDHQNMYYLYVLLGILLRRQIFNVNEGNDDWRDLIYPEKYGLTQTQNFYIPVRINNSKIRDIWYK